MNNKQDEQPSFNLTARLTEITYNLAYLRTYVVLSQYDSTSKQNMISECIEDLQEANLLYSPLLALLEGFVKEFDDLELDNVQLMLDESLDRTLKFLIKQFQNEVEVAKSNPRDFHRIERWKRDYYKKGKRH